jgi:hypothetical protein
MTHGIRPEERAARAVQELLAGLEIGRLGDGEIVTGSLRVAAAADALRGPQPPELTPPLHAWEDAAEV